MSKSRATLSDTQLIVIIREHLNLMQGHQNWFGLGYDLTLERAYLNQLIRDNLNRQQIIRKEIRNHDNYLALLYNTPPYTRKNFNRKSKNNIKYIVKEIAQLRPYS